MKILLVGGGGREHCIAWKLTRDMCRPEVFCAPGNAGTAAIATNLPIASEDVPGLVSWAKRNKPDLTVVGPEAPLCAGLTDRLTNAGFRVFGPSKAAARIEGSKVFSKDVMEKGGVPSARSASFNRADKALAYLRTVGAPIVVKADGLAAGKGVYVCQTLAEAEQAVCEIMKDMIFGGAGKNVLIEEFLQGEELSILALVDGKNVVLLSSAQDHKRVFDNDQGPNTGGMGAYSPAPAMSDKLMPVVRDHVFGRTLAELKRRGIEYKGVLYAGLMITSDGPKVLEFNCRFGDPETQVILPRMKSDLVPALEACIDGKLVSGLVKWKQEAAVCVVMASGGYPGNYRKGTVIKGLRQAGSLKDVMVFHAGTANSNGRVVSAGGRVLGITSLGKTLPEAVDKVYRAVDQVSFDGGHYRKDIAARALKRRK